MGKGGKPFTITYTDKKTKAAEETFIALATEHKPEQPILGPIYLMVDFRMPIPKSTSKKRTQLMHYGNIKHTKRPDLDNLCKLVKDAMNGIFWKDDSQIIHMDVSKGYDLVPQTKVLLEWEPEDV
jgi:Holliday junction resolvase RusA-like endonuclease